MIIRYLVLFGLFFVLISCGNGSLVLHWKQFHANGPNQGFSLVNTQDAIAPLWSIDLEPIIHSSPVLDDDGNIYIGASNGRLLKIDPDGVPICSSNHLGETIVSSPSVGGDGNIYFITNEPLPGDKYQSTLRSMAPDCEPIWSHTFGEAIAGVPAHTTASPKTFTTNQGTFVVVPVNLSKVCETNDCNDVDDGLNELMMFNGRGALINRKTIGGCITFGDPGSSFGRFTSEVWDNVKNLGGQVAPQQPLYETYGWLDPTVSIVDYNTVVEDSNAPFLIVANQCLGLRLTAFKVNSISPQSTSRVWTHEVNNRKYNFTSPAVFSNGLILLGRGDGLVQAFDIFGGDKIWDYDTNEAVMATPASFGRQILVTSLTTLHLLDYNGNLVETLDLGAETLASPSLSANHIHQSTTKNLHSLALDISNNIKDTSNKGGLVTPAIGKNGRVISVHYTEGHSVLRSYPGN